MRANALSHACQSVDFHALSKLGRIQKSSLQQVAHGPAIFQGVNMKAVGYRQPHAIDHPDALTDIE
jgi:hypothetical protein